MQPSNRLHCVISQANALAHFPRPTTYVSIARLQSSFSTGHSYNTASPRQLVFAQKTTRFLATPSYHRATPAHYSRAPFSTTATIMSDDAYSSFPGQSKLRPQRRPQPARGRHRPHRDRPHERESPRAITVRRRILHFRHRRALRARRIQMGRSQQGQMAECRYVQYPSVSPSYVPAPCRPWEFCSYPRP